MKFWAAGKMVPKGNMIALCPRRKCHHRGHSTPCIPFVTADTRRPKGGGPSPAERERAWETAVRVASREVAPPVPLSGPVQVHFGFRIHQPKCHAKEPFPPFSPADASKIQRAVEDALQAVCDGYLIADDKQIVRWSGAVDWADERGPGVEVEVTPLGPEQQTLFGSRA